MLWKRRSLRIIRSMISEGGITVKPGQDSIHELIIWKVNSFVASVTCSRYQMVFKWSVNFLLQFLVYDEMENLSMDEMSRQKFHNELACVFTAYYASKNADWNQQQLTDGVILANRNSANHPHCFLSNQKKVQILFFFFWHVICERNVSYPPPENRLQR